MIKKLLTALLVVLSIPAAAMAGQIGGLAGNIGGQMLTVTADIGYNARDVEKGGSKDELSSRSFVIKTTYGLSDSLDIFVSLGFADVQDIGDFNGALGTLYGGGFKYLLFGGGGNETQVSINGNFETFESEDSGKEADYQEYHIAAVVSKKSGNVTPFGGIKISDAEVDIEGTGKYDADDNFGLFGGVDYFVNPNVYFTGEVHIFDENTIYIGVGYNF